MTPRLRFALDAVRKAGQSTLEHFQSGLAVEYKSDASPVTVADKNAEAILRAAINHAYPGETILGEEQGLTGTGDTRWIIDPIDGTKSFICGVPLYATLLSYEVDGQPILGVSYFPALDEMVYERKRSLRDWPNHDQRRFLGLRRTEQHGEIWTLGWL